MSVLALLVLFYGAALSAFAQKNESKGDTSENTVKKQPEKEKASTNIPAGEAKQPLAGGAPAVDAHAVSVGSISPEANSIQLTAETVVNVAPPPVDLVIEGAGFILPDTDHPADKAEAGRAGTIRARVKNDSDLPLEKVTVKVDVDGTIIEERDISIKKRARGSFEIDTYTFNDVGRYVLRVTVDPDGRIQETNEENNQFSSAINITQALRRANLRVETRYGDDPEYDQSFPGASIVISRHGQEIAGGMTPYDAQLEVDQLYDVTVSLTPAQMRSLGLTSLQPRRQTSNVGIPDEGWTTVFYYMHE